MVSRVLIAIDDPAAGNRLRRALEAEDVSVLGAESADEVLSLLDSHELDLILIQTDLPGLPARELAHICSQRTGALVLVVDLRATESISVGTLPDILKERDLEARAEVTSRVGALRMIDVEDDPNVPSQERRQHHCLSSGDLTLWLEQNTATIGDREVPLKPIEAQILRVLLEHSPRVVPPELIIARVWTDDEADLSTLAVGITALRTALADDPLHPSRIVHVEGYGFKLTPQR